VRGVQPHIASGYGYIERSTSYGGYLYRTANLQRPNDLVGAAREHELGRQTDSKRSIGALTPREQQIALLVSEGLTDNLVGEQLNLAESTVKAHLHHIYRKLGIPNRTALSVLAITHRDWLTLAEKLPDQTRGRATKLN
jgi:DNA-binding CsgD family transcriptional regulator